MPTETDGRAALMAAPKAEHVRNFVREWRFFRDMTQQTLAAKMGISHVAISMLENGRTGYTQGILEKLAEALECSPADLIAVDPFLKEDEPAPAPAPEPIPEPIPLPPPLSESDQALIDLPEADKRLVHALLKTIRETDHEQG